MKETVEEFISKSNTPDGLDQFSYEKGLEAGAKWQAEQMYSEEDMISFVTWLSDLSFDLQHFNKKGLKPFNELFPIWFKQYKNK